MNDDVFDNDDFEVGLDYITSVEIWNFRINDFHPFFTLRLGFPLYQNADEQFRD